MRTFLLILTVLAIATPSAFAEEAKRTLTISGEGVIDAEPDTAEIRTAVITNEKTAGKAMLMTADKQARILKALSAFDIAKTDIQTGSVNLSPVYKRDKNNRINQQKIIGYRATIDTRVRVRELKNLGSVIDGLTQNGADRLNGVRFYIADDKRLRDDARVKAIRATMVTAERMAKAANAVLGDVLSISETGGGRPGPQPRMAMMAADSGGVPVMPGEVSIRARVHMVFSLK